MKSSLVVFLAGVLLGLSLVVTGIVFAYRALDRVPVPVSRVPQLAEYGLDLQMSVGALLVRLFAAGLAIVFLLAFAAGSSAGNLAAEFPLRFRLACWFRTPILMFVVTPLSFLMRQYAAFQIWYDLKFPSVTASHAELVSEIQDQVQAWKDGGKKTKMRTARPNWASMSTKLASNKGNTARINVGKLNRILEVQYEGDQPYIICEPGVTMGQITHELVPKGFALQIQVEMESITIGGVSMGFGMETNSHTVGFFQESVLEFEVVTPDAKVRQVSAKSDPELFHALPWSAGTLGFLTAVKVKIIPVKPYVKIRYIPTKSPEELAALMRKYSESPNAPTFLEATVFNHDNSVIQIAEFVDTPSTREEWAQVNPINRWYKPFYYKWVETFIAKGGGEEIVPLMHYYHRFTRSVFWELEDMIPFSNHPIYRTLWGWMGAPEVSLLKLAQGPVIRKASVYAHVVQESIMPVRHLAEGVRRFDKWFGVYPLLVFALRVYDRGPLSGFLKPQKRNLVEGKNWGIWVDLGAYGAPRATKQGKVFNAKANIREMEHWTRDKGGWQAYYTDLFCTRREFRQMFSHELLDNQRKRLGCQDAFPDVYDKIRPEKGIVDLDDEIAAEEAQQNDAQTH